MPESTQVVTLKQYQIPGGQKEIATLIKAMLEVKVLVPKKLLYNSPVYPVKKGRWVMETNSILLSLE